MIHTLKQRRLFYEVLSPDTRIIKFSRWNSMGHLSDTLDANEKLKKNIFLERGFTVLHYINS